MSFRAYRSELRRQEGGAPSACTSAPAATVPGTADAATHEARAELAMRIQTMERQLSAARVDLRQLQGVVDQGLVQYRPALAAKRAECDALESRVNALHGQKL